MVSHHTPNSHSVTIDVDNIDAAVNIAYGFGASPLAVRTLLFKLSSLFTYLYQRLQPSIHPKLDTICFMQGGQDEFVESQPSPRMQKKIPTHTYYVSYVFNYAFNNSTLMLLIIRNFLIVYLCFVMQHDIYPNGMTFVIGDPPPPPCTCMFRFL